AGMLDLAGFEKPLFCLRKALWTKEPSVRIAVGDGGAEDRGTWNETFLWEGKNSEKKRVSVYTNEPEAELFLNNCPLGKKTLRDEDGCRLVWEVPYAEGELRCVTPHASDSLCTPGKAEKLRLTPDRTQCPAEGTQAVTLEIHLEDGQGRAARDEAVSIQVSGDLKLLGIENGRPDDLTPYPENCRQTLCGRAIAYVRAGTCPGKAAVYARTESGLTAEITLDLIKS
ncbi:MAG: DUF4982 domain-containing protein, partial [Clostridia bacterium]|nr:DUF4982 domain-containing protein [Clostridia bacterium]